MPFSRKIGVALAVFMLALSGATPASARRLASTVEELDRMPPAHPDFPVPKEPNQLFYVQRSRNSNTIIYAANIPAPGQFDAKSPLNVYWRRYMDASAPRADLNFLERSLAFGADAKSQPGEGNKFQANITSYPERKFIVDLDESGKPEAVLDMGGHAARMLSIYAQLDETGLIPRLVYGDIYGIDKATGRVLHEHIVPA